MFGMADDIGGRGVQLASTLVVFIILSKINCVTVSHLGVFYFNEWVRTYHLLCTDYVMMIK